MNSNTYAADYFRELSELSEQMTAHDEQGEDLGFSAGILRFAEMTLACRDRGGTVYFIGNGGSSGIVSHMAADFTKNGRIPALTFTDNSLLTCLSNDLGYENVYSEPIKIIAKAGDMLIAVSSSGQSDNILNAVAAAKDKGMDVVTLSGFQANNPLRGTGDLRFYVPSSKYGYVECLHQSVIHCALDFIMDTHTTG